MAVETGQADVLGVDQLTTGLKVFADQVLTWHHQQSTPQHAALNMALPLPASAGLLFVPVPGRTLAA